VLAIPSWLTSASSVNMTWGRICSHGWAIHTTLDNWHDLKIQGVVLSLKVTWTETILVQNSPVTVAVLHQSSWKFWIYYNADRTQVSLCCCYSHSSFACGMAPVFSNAVHDVVGPLPTDCSLVLITAAVYAIPVPNRICSFWLQVAYTKLWDWCQQASNIAIITSFASTRKEKYKHSKIIP
jgi:hypothetical protein